MKLTVSLYIIVLITFTFCPSSRSESDVEPEPEPKPEPEPEPEPEPKPEPKPEPEPEPKPDPKPEPESANYCDDVKQWGFHCKSCSSMINCIQLPTGDWQTIPIGECDKNEYCNRNEQQCSKEPDCTIEAFVEFKCIVEGVFPDPYDCGKYHICANETGKVKTFNMECLNEFGYSTKTKECSLNKQTSKFCKARQYTCKKYGDMAPWPENPQIFYICVQEKDSTAIYPEFFQCKYGEHFNGKQCLKKHNNGTTTVPPGGSDGEPISPTDSPIAGSCQKEGLFINPNDCRKYFICHKNLISQEVSCPNNTHFDDHIKACVLGACV